MTDELFKKDQRDRELQREQTAATILAALIVKHGPVGISFPLSPDDMKAVRHAVAMADALLSELKVDTQ